MGSEVVDVRGVTGLVRQGIGCVNVVFDVRLAVRAAEVRARTGSRLVVVPADEVRDFLARGSAYPPAVAGLL